MGEEMGYRAPRREIRKYSEDTMEGLLH